MGIKSSGVQRGEQDGQGQYGSPGDISNLTGAMARRLGADYDPTTGELNLHSQVSMTWRGTDPGTIPMKIETDQLNYKENDGKVFLTPWSKLTRDTLTMNAGPAIVTHTEGQHQVGGDHAGQGNRSAAGAQSGFRRQSATAGFNDYNQIQKITGVDQAHVVSMAKLRRPPLRPIAW